MNKTTHKLKESLNKDRVIHNKKGDYIQADTVGKLVILAIVLFLVMPVITIYAINSNVDGKLSELKVSIESLNNNKGYSQAIKSVSDSVYMIIKHPVEPQDTANMGSIYTDSKNVSWKKGTGFAVSRDGWILTAKHVVDNADDIRVVSYENGKEETYSILYIQQDGVLDLAILKINKTTKSVTIYDVGEKFPAGSKVGFIGFPSDKDGAKIAHDATISYGDYGDSGFPIYNVHAFVNGGHSGGPVFLADSGEVIGFITSRAKASNLPDGEYTKEYVYLSKLPQEDQTLLFLANMFNRQTEMFNRQTEMYNLLKTEVSDKTQMGVGVVIGINRATVESMIERGRDKLNQK